MWNTTGLDPNLIIDPQTEPATEFVLDEYVAKMSPRGSHSFAQRWFTLAFARMAEDAGRGQSGMRTTVPRRSRASHPTLRSRSSRRAIVATFAVRRSASISPPAASS